jgi:O-antigen/teichoic acid export membrane protein
MKESKIDHSFKKRFVSKLTTNMFKILAGLATLGFIPRALGVETYGDLGFLTVFFKKVVKLLKVGTSTAYFVKVSKDNSNKKIIGFYFYYITFLSLMLFTGVLWGVNSSFKEIIFPGQQAIFIYAACLIAVLYLFLEFFNNTNDAIGSTVQNEVRIIIVSLLNAAFITIMYFTNTITLGSVFILNSFIFLFLIYLSNRVLIRNDIIFFKYLSLTRDDIYKNLSDFYKFSNPLIVNGIIVFFAIIIDRWLLQHYHGSVEQGYYTIAFQIAAILMVFANSSSLLILREMSQKIINDNDSVKIKKTFIKYSPIFYFVAVFFSIFVSVNSDMIVSLVGGTDYKNAGLVLAIMALYPINHAYGISLANIILAKEDTKVLRHVTLLTLLPGILLSLFILLPVDSGGLNYGAVGLAVKTVAIQFIAVNIYLWIISKNINISFVKHFLNQFLIIFVVLLLAKISQFLSLYLLDNNVLRFFLSGVFYCSLIIISIKIFPSLIGLSAEKLNKIASQLKSKIVLYKN